MCGDVIELIQDTPHLSLPQQSHDHTMESDTESHDESPGMYRIWDKYLLDNKEKWRQGMYTSHDHMTTTTMGSHDHHHHGIT